MIKKLIQTWDSLKLLYFTVNHVVESSPYNATQFIKLKLQITSKLNFSNIRSYGLECNFPKLEWWSDKNVRPIEWSNYSYIRVFARISKKLVSSTRQDRTDYHSRSKNSNIPPFLEWNFFLPFENFFQMILASSQYQNKILS